MKSPQSLTIATRESPLALWQARHVQTLLMQRYPDLSVELLGMTTRGDQILDSPLAKVGGKGLFVKELETALLDGRADIAVHSCKDMPAELPDGLQLMVIDQRETPYDALVLPASSIAEGQSELASLDDLPKNAIVGTSSLRRKCQIMAIRPDIQCRDLRGNVNTRLAKLDAGDYDAIVLAAAGLQRLGMAERISLKLPTNELLPAVGQGALAIELREGDAATRALVEPLVDDSTVLCVAAERGMNAQLEGGCQVPIAGFAEIANGELTLRGRVGSIDGSLMLAEERSMTLQGNGSDEPQAEALGRAVADDLLKAGADKLLAQVLETGLK